MGVIRNRQGLLGGSCSGPWKRGSTSTHIPRFDQMKKRLYQKSDTCQLSFDFMFRNQRLLQDHTCNTVKNDFSIHSYSLDSCQPTFRLYHTSPHFRSQVSKFHHMLVIYIYIYYISIFCQKNPGCLHPPWAPALFFGRRRRS